MKQRLILISAIVCLILSSWIGRLLHSNYSTEKWNQNLTKEEGEGFLQQAALGLIGDFRKTIASYLWVKSDVYHHIWEEFENKSWKENAENVPVDRLITYLDPSFVDSYYIGGSMLGFELNRIDEGISFLREGIKNNPDASPLYLQLGLIYLIKLNDNQNAVDSFLKGAIVGKKDYFESIKKEKEAKSVNEAEEYKQEKADAYVYWMQNTFFAGNTLVAIGKRKQAIEILNDFLVLYPEDISIKPLYDKIILNPDWKPVLKRM